MHDVIQDLPRRDGHALCEAVMRAQGLEAGGWQDTGNEERVGNQLKAFMVSRPQCSLGIHFLWKDLILELFFYCCNKTLKTKQLGEEFMEAYSLRE